ncbi:MAG TPA: hypothetical protein VN039_15410 [Nitrospira sp.]|nr:hypothetical protein [Nitrospira sp.]
MSGGFTDAVVTLLILAAFVAATFFICAVCVRWLIGYDAPARLWRRRRIWRDGDCRVNINFGTPETGHWCDRCMKPSVYVMPLTALRPDGVKDLGAQAVKCLDCGHGRIEETP